MSSWIQARTWPGLVGRLPVLPPRWSERLDLLRTPLTALLGAALAAGLCGFFLHAQGFVVLAGIGLVIAAGLAWPWLSVVGLSGCFAYDRERGREGEPMFITLRLRNRMPWGAHGVLVVESIAGADAVLARLSYLPGWSEMDLKIEFIPDCRGVYPRGRVGVRSGFPFGLWEASRALPDARTLVVWPRTFPVVELPDHRGDGGFSGRSSRDRPGNWGEPMGVRSYRRGDPLRRVHWGLSARHGELIVTEVQSSSVPRVRIVLDVDPAVHGGSGSESSREWAIRVAGSLGEFWTRDAAEVELWIGATLVPRRGGSAASKAVDLLDALARVGDAATGQGLAMPGGKATAADPRAGVAVVVTTDVRLRSMESLPAELRGARLVVLRASGFQDERPSGAGMTDLPASPWIGIDGPGDAAQALRRLAIGKVVAGAD